MVFHHSVKVPALFKIASQCVKKVDEKKSSIKDSVYNARHPNIKALTALVSKTVQYKKALDHILHKTELLTKEPRLNEYLARVLITELLYGSQRLAGEAKPIQTILNYQSDLEKWANKEETLEKVFSEIKAVKPRYVRVNTLKNSVDELIDHFISEEWEYIDSGKMSFDEYLDLISNLQEYQFTRDVHIDCLLVFSSRTTFFKNDYYWDGRFILQDKASCMSAVVLKPCPGSIVMDMCAAPGMKTTLIASLMSNNGKIFAVEKSEHRAETLKNFVQISGSDCVEVLRMDATAIDYRNYVDVEYILVDPSCTGSGIIDNLHRVDLSEDFGPQRLNKLSGFQIKLLRFALRNFPKAKRIVYSTCSTFPQENEEVVLSVLNKCLNYDLVDVKNDDCFKRPWINPEQQTLTMTLTGQADDIERIRNMCIYADPIKHCTNGFFIAVFERKKSTHDLDTYELQREMNDWVLKKLHGKEDCQDNLTDGGDEKSDGDKKGDILNEEKLIGGFVDNVNNSKKMKFNRNNECENSAINKEDSKNDDLKTQESTSEIPKKHKKKKKHAENDFENSSMKVSENWDADDNLLSKTKHKKKSKRHNDDFNWNVANEDAVGELGDKFFSENNNHGDAKNATTRSDNEEIFLKKPKKNKSERSHKQLVEHIGETEINFVKKHKKYVESTNQAIIEHDYSSEILENKLELKLKKKRKKSHKSTSDDDNKNDCDVNQSNECSETIKRKKKQKNKKHAESSDQTTENVTETIEITLVEEPKKKRKKSDKNTSDDNDKNYDCENPENEPSETVKRKKKHKKRKHSEN